MKTRIITLLISTVSFLMTYANNNLTQNIRGRVIDEVTETPLIGATVILLNADPLIGTTTDENGFFVLENIPIGRQSIEVSYVGYKTERINNMLLVSGKEKLLEISLIENVVEVDEVSVKAFNRKDRTVNDMAMVSARSFTVEETERFAGSLGDPARMVANYAGVMTQNDSRNDIIIRGNSPVGVLWRLEGIEIPNPNHFGALGTTGGPVSMLNNNLLTNSDFLTGAFPAEYGNATAGAFDLNMRSGNRSEREYVGQVGFNGFEFGAEGPFSMKKEGVRSTYLVNYRYSTLGVLHELGISTGTGEAIPQYQDLTFNIDIPGTKYGRFQIIGLGGTSFIELGHGDGEDDGNSYNARSTITDFGSDLGVIGLAHTYFFNEKSRLNTTVSAQRTGSSTKLDSLKRKTGETMPFVRSWQYEDKYTVSSRFKSKINSKNNYSVGGIIDQYRADFIDSVYITDDQAFRTMTEGKGNMMLLRGYGQWQHRISDNLTTYAGLYTQFFTLNNEIAIEPRLSVRWQFAKNHSLNAGYGKHSQVQPKTIYFNRSYDETNDHYFKTNEDVKFTRSDHYVLGYDWLINKDFRLKAETYYQDLYNIPVVESFPEFSMVNAGDFFAIPSIDSLVNEGSGRNYGAEITLEKFLSKGYYFLFTTSIFDSKYKGYDGVERNTAFNGNYVFNLLGGYEFKVGKHALLTIDLKTVWAGGKRYIPIDLDESIKEKSTIRDWSQAFEDKYDDYFRTDIRIGIKTNNKKFSQEWGVDLQNLTGYQSIFMEQFDPEDGTTYKVYQQGFYPMVLYRIQF